MKNAKDTVPKGYIYYGYGPLKFLSCGLNDNVAMFKGTRWDKCGWTGNETEFEYAVKAGTEIARLNGLKKTIEKRPLPTLPNNLPKLPNNLVYVGEGPFDWMEEARPVVKPFLGDNFNGNWTLPLGYYSSGIHRALHKDSLLLKKYFILPETSKNSLTSTPESTTMTTMKAKITLKVINDKVKVPFGYTAFSIVEQENIPNGSQFVAKNGIKLESWQQPEFSYGDKLWLRGKDKSENDIILVVRTEQYAKIEAAVKEYVETLNKPEYLYVATFFYKNEKNGAKKRRLVEVQKEDDEYIEGIDKDVDNGVPFRRFLKKNIIGSIVPVK